MWQNVKYYLLAYVVMATGSLVSTALHCRQPNSQPVTRSALWPPTCPPSPPASPRESQLLPDLVGQRFIGPDAPLLYNSPFTTLSPSRLAQFIPSKPLGQCRQRLQPTSLDPRQVFPSVAHYDLAQVPLRVKGGHGQ